MGLRSKQEKADLVAMMDATEKRLDENARLSWENAREDYQRKLIQSVEITASWITIEHDSWRISFPKSQVIYSVSGHGEESWLMFGPTSGDHKRMKILKGIDHLYLLNTIRQALDKPDDYKFPMDLLDQTNPFAEEWTR